MKGFTRTGRWLLALLVLTVLLAPCGATVAKYVCQIAVDTFSLEVIPAASASPVVTFSLENLTGQVISLYAGDAEASDVRVYLQADSGYVLPESLLLSIDGKDYGVSSGDAEAQEGIVYDASSGLLLIPSALLKGNPSHVLVTAVGVLATDPEPDMDPESGTDPEPGTDPESGTDPTPGTDPAPGTDPESGKEPTPGTEPAPGTDPEPGADSALGTVTGKEDSLAAASDGMSTPSSVDSTAEEPSTSFETPPSPATDSSSLPAPQEEQAAE